MNALESEAGRRTGFAPEPPHVLELFDGIRFAYFYSIQPETLDFGADTERPIFVLGCIDGELKLPALENDEVLSPGDVAVLTDRRCLQCVETSGEMFCGLMLILAPDLLPERVDCFLTGMQLDLKPWLNCGGARKSAHVLRGNFELRRMLSDCAELPDSIRMTFQKLKVVELLLYLGSTIFTPCDASYLPGFQLNRIRAVREYLKRNIDRRVTLDELADRFNMSQSSLKACFKCAYGLPIATYARNCRLERAASLLRKSQHSILEIACMIGYENPGKFAEAFRSVYQVSPSQYRKEKNRLDYSLAVQA